MDIRCDLERTKEDQHLNDDGNDIVIDDTEDTVHDQYNVESNESRYEYKNTIDNQNHDMLFKYRHNKRYGPMV